MSNSFFEGVSFRPMVEGYPSAVPFDELTRLLCQDVGASICVIGNDLRFKYVNEPFARALGLTPTEMLGMTMGDAYGEAHVEAVTENLRKVLAGESLNYERFGKLALRDGLWRTVALRPWRDAHNKVIGVIGVSMAVQELKNAAEKLRVANERLSSHIENSPLVVIDLDANLRVTYCSPRTTLTFGHDTETLVGHNVLDVLGRVPGDELKSSLERLQRGLESRNRASSVHARRDGSLVHCEWFNSAHTDAQGNVTSIMSLIEDVTARVEAEVELRQMLSQDLLTGLHNRASLEARLNAALAQGGRRRALISVLFVDLDGFKGINDAHGHVAGDEVLCEVALRLSRCVRDQDMVARLGGDEFVVLTESDENSQAAENVAVRIFDALAEPISFKGGQALISASIGIAQHPPLPGVATELMKRADAAMYEAKHAGKGRSRHAV